MTTPPNRSTRVRTTTGASYFFDALLEGALPTDEEIRTAASDANLEVRAPCAVLALVPASGDPRVLAARVRAFRTELPDAVTSPVRFDPHPHVVALVELRNGGWRPLLTRLAAQTEECRVVIVAEPAPTLDSIGPLYQGFRRTLTVAPRLRPRVIRALDLAHLWSAGCFDADERFLQVDSVLGGNLGRRADYAQIAVDTLVALRDSRGDIPAAARRLGIKESSVYSRLTAIEEHSGLSLDNPRDLATLGWVTSLYTYDPESLPDLGDPRWGRRARISGRVAHQVTTFPMADR